MLLLSTEISQLKTRINEVENLAQRMEKRYLDYLEEARAENKELRILWKNRLLALEKKEKTEDIREAFKRKLLGIKKTPIIENTNI